MTDQEIRIAVAEACGWYRLPQDSETWAPKGWVYGKDVYGKLRPTIDLPDYPNDLNAMHEAEMMLNGEKDDEHSELAQYYESLCLVCGDGMEPLNVYEVDLIRSTARQRAEAFLRVKGLWKE